MKRLVGLLSLAALGALACSDEPPPASANLRRPAGMAYAERPRVQDTPVRDDMFIADSEAEGVRVRQFVEDKGVLGDKFIPSHVIYIPLTIAAPGFPEELSLSTEPSHARLYVLAPAGVVAEMPAGGGPPVERVGLLHVLDVQEAPFPGRASDPGNAPIGTILLDQLTAQAAIPTDVVVLSSSSTSSSDKEDLVAIVFDPVAGGPGVVALVTVRFDATAAVLSGAVETATVTGAPRALFLSGDRLLVAGASGTAVSELHFQPGSGVHLLGSRQIDVGGPSHQLLGGPGGRVLALRLDRASVVVLDPSSNGFVRSSDYLDSPYTPNAERQATPLAEQSGELALGRIDLRGSPVSAGALGRVSVLADTKHVILRGGSADGTADVALIAHVDGVASFVAGEPPRLVLSQLAGVSELRQFGDEATKIGECGSSTVTVPACLPQEQKTGCPLSIVRLERPADVHYRAVYRGDLANGYSGSLSWVSSSTSSAQLSLSDGNVPDFELRKIAPGDLLRFQVRAPKVCPAAGETVEEIDVIDSGVITTVSGGMISAQFTGPALDFVPCGGAVTVRYNVFPSVEEAVLSEVRGEAIVAVHERVPASGGGAVFARELAFTLQSGAGFLCRDGSASEGNCNVDADCGSGRVCAPGLNDGCLRRCAESCEDGAVGCMASPLTRVCSGLELTIQASRALTQDLRGDPTRPTLVAAPAAAIFSPLRKAWFVTYPGSRTMAEVRPAADGFAIGYAR